MSKSGNAYIRTVSKRTGITPDTLINVSDKETMIKLAEAISFQENSVPGDVADIAIAWQMLTGM